PSSSVQPSERLYWKKRSASSARWARMVPKTRSVATWSTPNGVSKVALAMSRVDGSGLVTCRLNFCEFAGNSLICGDPCKWVTTDVRSCGSTREDFDES